MGLDFGLFTRRDVRETPAATATATSVGLTTPEYLTLALDADLVNERVLTPGEGIDFSDTGANGTLTINAENSTSGNRGVVIVAPGGGINVSYASGTATVSAEDSTAGNKGAVIVAGGEGITVNYASGTATVAGEDASTTNKGIAQFNSSDFSTSSGTVSLKSKTSYLAISPASFRPHQPDVNDVNISGSQATVTAGTVNLSAGVELPHGAVVTGCIVYGTAAETWNLIRVGHDGVPDSTMASAAVETEDTSITDATIDNSTYSYVIAVLSLDAGDDLWGARITYTTDYI